MSGTGPGVVSALRSTFISGRTKSLKWRKVQLAALIAGMEANRSKICDAMQADFSKPPFETTLTEIEIVIQEAHLALTNINNWSKAKKVDKNFLTMMNECYVQPEPLGVVLVLGAWNYPFQVTLCPLVAAIAAGNCCILKPSELAPHAAKCMEQVINESLDEDAIRVIPGGVDVAKDLLSNCRFDSIFYTGGPRVGRIVMEAASKHLTPVILELGGKSPVFVHRDVDFEIAANRIAWGRFTNVGQTCVAPDYILTTADVQPKLVKELKRAIKEFYGEDIEQNSDFGRIVNEAHFKRLQSLLASCEPKVVCGGKFNASTRYIEPTVVADVSPNDEIMKEEIFGPILPIMIVDSYDKAIQYINEHEKPLTLYVFSKNKEVTDMFRQLTSSGAFDVNDCLMHVGLSSLPFGGVGNSGMGSYHGKAGFDALSHMKACYVAPLAQEAFNAVRYPPYSDEKLSVVNWLGNTERSLSVWLFKPLVWAYILIVFMVRLATLPRRRR